MAFPCHLAMTAAEFATASALPQYPAWMACHFSPYGTGLSNCPEIFPEGAMLIVNDRTPVAGHDSALIAAQLCQMAEEFAPEAVLLDFQRSGVGETAAIAKAIVQALPCPVGVSAQYAELLTCPVFLPPPPLHIPLEQYLLPWQGRELWLEAALCCQQIAVTPEGSRCLPCPFPSEDIPCHADPALHCHYCIDPAESEIRFTLFRTPEDLAGLLRQAQALGVRRAVGLYQQLHDSAALNCEYTDE